MPPRLIGLALAAGIAAACAVHQVRLDVQAPATFADEPGGYELAEVTRVIDGDTVEVRIVERISGPGAGSGRPGATYSVRLVGIDTPESVHPSKAVECFGRESSSAATALLDGREVRLVRDVEDRDRFDRLLRYVYLGEEMANARLVTNGYAYAYTYPPNVRWSELFVQLQREARGNDRGLWSNEACNGDTQL